MNGSDSNLRALIRAIRVARALKAEVEHVENLEMHQGSGQLIVGSFQRLLGSITKLTDDPFIASLSEGLGDLGTDSERVLAVKLAISQLIAFLESETGVAGLAGESGASGPQFSVGSITGMPPEDMARMFGLARGAPLLGGEAGEE